MVHRFRGLVALAIAAAALTACGGGSGPSAGVTTTDDSPELVAPTTVPTPVTELPSDDASTTTEGTEATTTTLGLPVPVPPPADPYGVEPLQGLGTIDIPKISVHDTFYEGIRLTTIQHGPSHWPGTAQPGQPGNVVIAAHRTTYSHPFLHIDQLVVGDTVTFTVAGVASTYVVTSHEIVRPTALWIVDQTPTATATLFACHPLHSAAFRYVVHLALATP